LGDGTPAYVAFTLPGEVVRVSPGAKRGEGVVAALEAVERPSPARISPACRHFGACGGCTLQHWRADEYAAWKSDLLAASLRRAGFADVSPMPMVPTAPGARRRMDLAVARVGGALRLGLHRAGAAEVIALEECPVLHPVLAALLAPLRGMLARLAGLRREASVVVNLLDSGPDLLLRTDAALTAADRALLADFARVHAMPRVSWGLLGARDRGMAETVAGLRPASTMLSGVEVVPPPGAFLQASRAGEAAIVAGVLAGLPAKLPPKARIVELFAGCGTLSFALARHARVAAFEGDAAAVMALQGGARQAGLEGRVVATHQDLARRPVLAKEFAPFAVAVLDPPFGGAAAQIAEIAASALRHVIYVSCNPAALARDAAVLRAAGFALVSATPIDQFLWSARLESVVVFSRRR
jgi:23S rRNA (uracil1939-C5)-methyltransferase